MTRNEKLRRRLEEEGGKDPAIALRELAKRLNLAEKALLGLLEDGIGRKVRADLEGMVLDEIRTWRSGLMQFQNDWAWARVESDWRGLSVPNGLLSLKTESTVFRIDYSPVDSIYFVEFDGRSRINSSTGKAA
jgi:hypothetical protein